MTRKFAVRPAFWCSFALSFEGFRVESGPALVVRAGSEETALKGFGMVRAGTYGKTLTFTLSTTTP